MRIESSLCHLSENKVIVKVVGWFDEKNLGSALAEGPTVEAAEDKAISRLNKRINAGKNDEASVETINNVNKKKPINIESPKSNKIEDNIIINEPSDWSNELTAIDIEIDRLKWTRDDEISFLNKNLGYNSRSKITQYSDIIKYLKLLKKTVNENVPNLVNKSIDSLIEESDKILRDLSWNKIQGRKYLQNEFNVSTRQELNEEQLLLFIEKLKSIRNQN
tara:strand:- start:489 stop:1148 length:660 start_codon:yes stop_codon:yes gene_type:complete